MSRDLFDEALEAARLLHAATSALRDFGGWPDDLRAMDIPPNPVPAAELVVAFDYPTPPLCEPLVEAFRAVSPQIGWRRTYSEDEVGADFLNRYGYAELFGPEGHFHSDQLRGYLAYWGEGLYYDWHRHEAEEIYFILSGGAEFHSQDRESIYAKPGDTIYHKAWQPHAMTTHAEPVLTFVLWRGEGMADVPRMDT